MVKCKERISGDNLEEAKAVTGFDMTAPKEIAGYTDIHYAAMRNNLIQVDYIANEDTCICIRKGIGTKDISGDWNEYSERQEAVIDGNTVTLQGNNGEVSLATWTDGTYAYSLMDDRGLKEEDALQMVREIMK